MNPRAGLKRDGFRLYIVKGPKGVWAIERDTKTRFHVRPRDWPRLGFFAHTFPRLREARLYAEEEAGLPCDLALAMPPFLRRVG